MFCGLQNLGKGKRDETLFQKRLAVAKNHVKFCVEVYRMQIQAGRFFLHEHPDSSTSWQMPEVVSLQMMEEVYVNVCDMCAYGMVAVDGQGEAPAKKRTRFMSNSYEIVKRLGKKCVNLVLESGERSLAPTDEAVKPKLPGGVPAKHRHADLTGGRARQCQVYPEDFSKAVCEGVAAQKRLMELGMKSEPLMLLEDM